MKSHGTFQVQMHPEPPYDEVEGVVLARVRFDKQFEGPLLATSTVHMLAARTTVDGSAGYVALERIEGTLDGRSGTFCVLHMGLMDQGSPSLQLKIVPDSGTGQLHGIRGHMDIQIVQGAHYYDVDYTLPG